MYSDLFSGKNIYFVITFVTTPVTLTLFKGLSGNTSMLTSGAINLLS